MPSIRVLAAVPLLAIGAQHLLGMAPMQPILEGAGLPMTELTAKVAPIVEILVGVSLLLGVFGRVGALLAIGSMVVALAAHFRFDWADEPPLVLPVAILLLTVVVLLRRSCAWSIDDKRRASH